jgi:ribosomal protein S11
LVAQSSSGARGFRGSRKGTPFAAQQAASEAARKASEAECAKLKFASKARAAVASQRFEQSRRQVFA